MGCIMTGSTLNPIALRKTKTGREKKWLRRKARTKMAELLSLRMYPLDDSHFVFYIKQTY